MTLGPHLQQISDTDFAIAVGAVHGGRDLVGQHECRENAGGLHCGWVWGGGWDYDTVVNRAAYECQYRLASWMGQSYGRTMIY